MRHEGKTQRTIARLRFALVRYPKGRFGFAATSEVWDEIRRRLTPAELERVKFIRCDSTAAR